MSKLDPRIEAIRVKYDLEPTDFWELPQKKGTWVAKHSALEVAAFKAGIVFESPQIIEADTKNGIAVLSVQGSFPPDYDKAKGRSEWATGEATPQNNRNQYPWAMAEKRAKDRVILKLIGIHGLVYSEDEMSEPTTERSSEPRAAPNSILREKEEGTALTGGPATQGGGTAATYARLQVALADLPADLVKLRAWSNNPKVKEAIASLPDKEALNINDAITARIEDTKELTK